MNFKAKNPQRKQDANVCLQPSPEIIKIMNIQLATKNNITGKIALAVFTLLIASFVLITVIEDFIKASFNNSSFYISEALMFSSFWWIFIPFMYGQYLLVKIEFSNSYYFKALLILIPILLHLCAFPFLVWVISELFYYHTFEIIQTLQYTLSEQLFKLILLYSIPIFVYQLLKAKAQITKTDLVIDGQIAEPSFITSILVSEGDQRKCITVSTILYFTANTPYINIYLNGKKYLKSETLKSISEKLNSQVFIRVHKSTIVNVEHVQSYTSRLNGDYDLIMSDGAELRVSRNFAVDFKKKFQESHRLTTK